MREDVFVGLLYVNLIQACTSTAIHGSAEKVQSMSYCRGIPGGSVGGLVVMESDHDEVPMSITNMPNDPGRGVRVEDQRQQDDVSYQHDGADQYDHQTNKDLPHKRQGRHLFQGKKKKPQKLCVTH